MDVFDSLPPQLQRRIDCALDQALQNHDQPSGGFLVEETNSNPLYIGGVGHGGLIIDDQVSQLERPELRSHIPLSAIPSALHYLDIPPDDEQVLSVFRNAASGWTSSSDEHNKMKEGIISRDDWRSVCAVLFENHEEEYANGSESGPMDFDEFRVSDRENDSEDPLSVSTDDEYIENPIAASSHRRAKHKSKSTSFSPSSHPSPPEKLSPRQQHTCLETFALFFPSIPTTEVVNQKITIKDIQRVSKLLGEKIKVNEACFICLSNVDHFLSLILCCRWLRC
jgi:hypothetical protein